MKIIEKSKIKEFNLLQSDRIQQVKHERFLVNIKETFQTESKIYIVMEYLPMGDLYYYLNKKDKPFSEETIIGIAAQIAVTLSILHSQGIVYRELKPENVLVTDDGHLKLTDYGLSKIIPQDRDLISTFVGTIEYMAPEAYGGNFGQKADIWSLGILLYELMFRENIFEIQANKIMSMLKEGTFPFDKTLISDKINSRIGCMSSQFRALLLRLLQPDPELRISLQQMREHDFFKGLSWQSVLFRPKVISSRLYEQGESQLQRWAIKIPFLNIFPLSIGLLEIMRLLVPYVITEQSFTRLSERYRNSLNIFSSMLLTLTTVLSSIFPRFLM